MPWIPPLARARATPMVKKKNLTSSGGIWTDWLPHDGAFRTGHGSHGETGETPTFPTLRRHSGGNLASPGSNSFGAGLPITD